MLDKKYVKKNPIERKISVIGQEQKPAFHGAEIYANAARVDSALKSN